MCGSLRIAKLVMQQRHRRADRLAKILNVTKSEDLAVEQPMKFEFVIYLKTANQIGPTDPPNVLVRAQKVIR